MSIRAVRSLKIPQATLAIMWCVLCVNSARVSAQELPDSIAGVVIEGNETIPASVILNKIQTQPNRDISNRLIREDKRQLCIYP